MAVVSDTRAILSGLYWYPGSPSAQAVFLTYSFSQQPPADMLASNPAAATTFRPFSDTEKAIARQALRTWSAVSGVTFVETTAHEGDLTFGNYDLSATGASVRGQAYFPSAGAFYDWSGTLQGYTSNSTIAGDVQISTGYLTGAIALSDLQHTMLHEVGHALGLKHSFEGTYTLAPALENGSETVMSYTAPLATTLGPLDIAAIQQIYGAPGAAHPATWAWDAASETFTTGANGNNQYLRGTGANDIVFAPGVNDAVVTGQGDDAIHANGQALSINAGTGYDKVYTGLTYHALPAGVAGFGDFRYTTGAANQQTYAGVEQLRFTDGVYYTATNRFAALTVAMTDTSTTSNSSQALTPYAGPVPYLDDQFIYTGTDNINLTAQTDNVFLKSQGGQDALQASGGHNVLDGGTGSNFLVGGSGPDTFFVDGRPDGVTWSTIASIGTADDVTLWGWLDGVTRSFWSDHEGAAGFEGLTLHADLRGNGQINASMTFSGLTMADRDRLQLTTGSVEGNAYLHITVT